MEDPRVAGSTSDHENRAQEMADQFRRYLLGFNTGGIVAMLTAATSLSSLCVYPAWIVPASLFFAIGIVLTLLSLLLQKHKALARRDAAQEGRSPPDFTRGFWRNFTWDLLALACFIAGLLFALSSLASLEPGC